MHASATAITVCSLFCFFEWNCSIGPLLTVSFLIFLNRLSELIFGSWPFLLDHGPPNCFWSAIIMCLSVSKRLRPKSGFEVCSPSLSLAQCKLSWYLPTYIWDIYPKPFQSTLVRPASWRTRKLRNLSGDFLSSRNLKNFKRNLKTKNWITLKCMFALEVFYEFFK